MPLSSNSIPDIEQYVGEQTAAPVFFPPFSIALKPMGTKWRFKGIYITDTSKPAWMDSNGAWKYADGSSV